MKRRRGGRERERERTRATNEEEQWKNIEYVDAEIIENNSTCTLSHINTC